MPSSSGPRWSSRIWGASGGGFVPIYNILSFTCTSVTGTAIDVKW